MLHQKYACLFRQLRGAERVAHIVECGSLSMKASQPSSNLEKSRRLLEQGQGQNGARHTVTVYRSALRLAPAKRRRWHA